MSSNRFRDNRRKANVIDTSQVELANAAPTTPEAAIRYDPATRGFQVKVDPGIPVNELIGYLRVLMSEVEDAKRRVEPDTFATRIPVTVTMTYDKPAHKFSTRVAAGVMGEGDCILAIPVNELLGFLQILLTALSIGPAAQLQMQMMQQAAQQQAQRVTLHTEMPPAPNLR